MIKHVEKVGDNIGIIIDKSFLDMLNIGKDGAVQIIVQEDGLFLKPIRPMDAYQRISQRHRASLDKLAK
ncbi:MAG: AbrB/MazE/SpoVT family DNA-binding domain-containing protein [Chloroflexota bacterium]